MPVKCLTEWVLSKRALYQGGSIWSSWKQHTLDLNIIPVLQLIQCTAQSRHWVSKYLLNGSPKGQILALPIIHWVAPNLCTHCSLSLPEMTSLQISSLGFCSNAFLLRGLRRKPKWNGTLALPFLLPILPHSHIYHHLQHYTVLLQLKLMLESRDYVCFICFCVSTQNSICMNESWRILVGLLFLICKVNGVEKVLMPSRWNYIWSISHSSLFIEYNHKPPYFISKSKFCASG